MHTLEAFLDAKDIKKPPPLRAAHGGGNDPYTGFNF